VLAAAAVHGGTGPDLLDEVASRQAGDFWQYAMYAAVACVRDELPTDQRSAKRGMRVRPVRVM
jgi:hypothetical protein